MVDRIGDQVPDDPLHAPGVRLDPDPLPGLPDDDPHAAGVGDAACRLDGADALASEWRYIPVRRLALHIENSLLRGLQWVVFEPNDEPLWASVRLNVTAFMSQLHRQGAFQGAAARDAYLVKCDAETTTQADINLGILNILVGFAPVRPAEFVMLRIQQRMQNSN